MSRKSIGCGRPPPERRTGDAWLPTVATGGRRGPPRRTARLPRPGRGPSGEGELLRPPEHPFMGRVVVEPPGAPRPRHHVEVVEVVAVRGADRMVASRH